MFPKKQGAGHISTRSEYLVQSIKIIEEASLLASIHEQCNPPRRACRLRRPWHPPARRRPPSRLLHSPSSSTPRTRLLFGPVIATAALLGVAIIVDGTGWQVVGLRVAGGLQQRRPSRHCGRR
jgi:hypothetical protein